MKKIRIIHVVDDDKFIDHPLDKFESDKRFYNQAVMIVDSPDYHFRLIKNTSRIKLLYTKKMVKEELQKKDYDAVFFYSLTNYRIFNILPKDKIVIWWAWGYDIYGPERFIDIPLYKPLTEKYISAKNSSIKSRVKSFFKRFPLVLTLRDGSKTKAIRRLDFFQPVIHTEYELMRKVPGFHALEFYYPGAHCFEKWFENEIPVHGNSIIIGHSATYTSNHLDVWNRVSDYIPNNTTVYFPINYGRSKYSEFLSSTIKSDCSNLVFLKDFLPLNDYYNIVDSCSYAVFGILREGGMGNIYRCIANGVKMFLYKDSIPYKYLKDLGCFIFAIDDINENSFRKPLTFEQASHNRNCLKKEMDFVEEVRETAIAKIISRISKQ